MQPQAHCVNVASVPQFGQASIQVSVCFATLVPSSKEQQRFYGHIMPARLICQSGKLKIIFKK
ncbi:MAG: hypothetical protein WCX71_00290 [Candidatus Buchananbacteria bacterium]